MRTLARQRGSRAIYLYMSMIVEFRALWFYGLYSKPSSARSMRFR